MIVTGSPSWIGQVSVLPIFSPPPTTPPDYMLVHEAIERRRLRFVAPPHSSEEPIEAINDSNEPVLFLQGDRIEAHSCTVDATTLLPARSQLRLHVRRAPRRRAPHRHRRLSVPDAKRLEQQGLFWRWLEGRRRAPKEEPELLALEAIQASPEALRYPKGASGIALGVDGQLRSIDLFDRAPVCERLWQERIGRALELSDPGPPSDALRAQTVHCALEEAQRLTWSWSRAEGIGAMSRILPPQKDTKPDSLEDTSAIYEPSEFTRLSILRDPCLAGSPFPSGSALKLGERLLHLHLEYVPELWV